MEQPSRDLYKVKVPIGIVRRNISNETQDTAHLLVNKIKSQEVLLNNAASTTALVNFCHNSYTRVKRKADPNSNGNAKILTIDADYKTKKSQRKQNDEHIDQKDSAVVRDIGPRVEIINGKIVIKESSLMIANQDSNLVEGEYEEVEEGIHASSRYSSFSNKRKAANWTNEETRDFYKAVQQCGTEFSVMETFFPKRTRKELKMKFFREENQHPELIKRALDTSVPLELKTFEEKFGEKLISEHETEKD